MTRRLVDGLRLVDDRASNGRLIVDGGGRRAVLSRGPGVDALLEVYGLAEVEQQELLRILEALSGGADALASLESAGLLERCDHQYRPGGPVVSALEQLVSRTISTTMAFSCRHEVLDRVAATRVVPFGDLELLPALAEVVSSNGMSIAPPHGDGGDSDGHDVVGVGLADLDNGPVCPLPPESFPSDGIWMRIGVSRVNAIIEVGPVCPPGARLCALCFRAGWPTMRGSPGADRLPGGVAIELITSMAATALLGFRALVPPPDFAAHWRRLDLSTCTDEEFVLSQRRDCPACDGGNLGCTVAANPSPGWLEERFTTNSPGPMTAQLLYEQNARALQAKQWSREMRDLLRNEDGGRWSDSRRPWHEGLPVGEDGIARQLRAATDNIDRIELACALAVGVYAEPGQDDGEPRRNAPSGGNIGEYLIMGVWAGPDGAVVSDLSPVWFDDEAHRFRLLRSVGQDRPRDFTEQNTFFLALVANPSLPSHKYGLHGLRLAYLDAGAAAFYLLETLRRVGLSQCSLEEPGGWETWLVHAGLNPDVWRLGTAVHVA